MPTQSIRSDQSGTDCGLLVCVGLGGKIGDEVRAKCRKTTLEPLVQQLKQRFAAVQSTVEKL